MSSSPKTTTTTTSAASTAIHEKTDISLNVINFLREHDGITGVDFVQSCGVSLTDLTSFEQREGVTLPDDYKSFLLTSDGFKLKWSVSFRTKIQPLGQLQLNRLREVHRIPFVSSDEWIAEETDVLHYQDDGGGSVSTNQHTGIGIETKLVGGRRIRMLRTIPSSVRAYEIDTTSPTTRVALLYGVFDLGATTTMEVVSKEGGPSCVSAESGGNGSGGSRRGRGVAADPQVWYSDNSSRWFFIANSFMDYFRLMVTNLGLPDWQSAYTDVGLDPTSKQWFNFLIPNRRRGSSGSSPLSSAGSMKMMNPPAGPLSFVAFTGEGPAGATGLSKGLVTLRDVTGTIDDTTSPVQLRHVAANAVQPSSTGSSRSSGRGGGGKISRSGRGGDVASQSKNAANWFDINHTDSSRSGGAGGSDQRRQTRPGSAPMRRRGDGRGRGSSSGISSRRL